MRTVEGRQIKEIFHIPSNEAKILDFDINLKEDIFLFDLQVKQLPNRIDERCVTDGCCRNDFIKSAIESKLNKNLVTKARIVAIDGVPVKELQNPKIVEI